MEKMLGAEALPMPRSMTQAVRDFIAPRMIVITAIVMFFLLVVFILWPIITILIKSIYGSDGLTWRYYIKFLSKGYYYRSLFNTMILGCLTTAVCVTVGFCLAYMTTRGPILFRKPMRLIALLPLIAPPYIFALSLVTLFGRSGLMVKLFGLNWNIYGFQGCVIAQTLAFLPLAYMMIENSLSSLNMNLEDSASNLGASEGKILRSLTIPLLLPGFMKAGLIVFVMAVAEFGNVALLAGRTPFLAPDTYTMITGAEVDFNMASVLSVFLMLPCAFIFFAQFYLTKGKSYTSIVGKPVAAEPRHITPLILIPFMAISLLTCLTVLATFGVTVVGSFTNIVGIDNTFTWRHIISMRANMSIWNSIEVSALTGFFGATVGIILAYVIVRGTFRGRVPLELMALSGFAFPGTAMGIGYIMAFNSHPLMLTGTISIIVLSSIFRSLVVGVEAGINKLQQLSIDVEEASSNLGATTSQTFRKVVFPIIFPAFVYGFLYLFLRTMVTLSSVIFLAAPGYDLASIFIYDAAIWGNLGLASATTLKMIIVCSACLGLLELLSRWTGLSVTRSEKGGAG
ncbi:MAG: ABC transporter permease [Syntrophales bacterium]